MRRPKEIKEISDQHVNDYCDLVLLIDHVRDLAARLANKSSHFTARAMTGKNEEDSEISKGYREGFEFVDQAADSLGQMKDLLMSRVPEKSVKKYSKRPSIFGLGN